jgi:hypothetical protein
MNDGSAKQQIVEGIKNSSNILVTVSDSPSVDELSAALGLTILLNNLDKRATAVVSGQIPPAITFLDPSKTFESTVDGLRDFIIALDKEKADHLRYKVDGDLVKIFITPYRTQLSNKDLDFSQGDYNVEFVIGIGVKDQDHMDKALSAHGRILHDATVTTISLGTDQSSLGSVDWRDAASSSYCEMLVGLAEALKTDKPVLDEQISTAFLTGIVSATDRFSNDRTSSRVMTMAAQLMAAGANQQLIAAKLEEAHDIGPNSQSAPKDTPNQDGTTSLAEGQGTKLKEADKKAKKDDTALSIARADEAKDKPKKEETSKDDATPVVETVLPQEPLVATDAPVAEPAPAPTDTLATPSDIEDELSKQLAEVADPVPTSLAEIEKELAKGAPSEPAPTTLDGAMPGFEALDVPEQPQESLPPVDDDPRLSPMISSHPTGGYIQDDQAGQPPMNGTLDSPNGGEPASIDPFSVPLPAMSTTQTGFATPDPLMDTTEVAQPEPQEAANVVADPVLPQLEDLAAQPVIQQDQSTLPPLPPLPDFSTLPPLPPPPITPFDQPGITPPSGAVSADQLGDIFGDTQPAPQAPLDPTPAGPPPPGQFKIPGQ